MRPDIALAGFVITADEWDALDLRARDELIAAAICDAPWFVQHVSARAAEAEAHAA